MKICIKGNIFNPSFISMYGEERAIEKGYTIFEVPNGYEDCAFEDFDNNGFNVELYNNRKQKEVDVIRLEGLTNWFDKIYPKYEQMFTRREKLGKTDTIEDEFRNRVGENAYHNLIELYEEAELVAKEIRCLREK